GINPERDPNRGSADHDLDHRSPARTAACNRLVRARPSRVHDHRRKCRAPRTGQADALFETLQRRLLATVLGCAAQTEGGDAKGGELKMTTSVLNATDRPDIRSALEARLSGASRRPVISRIGELEYLAQADW